MSQVEYWSCRKRIAVMVRLQYKTDYANGHSELIRRYRLLGVIYYGFIADSWQDTDNVSIV